MSEALSHQDILRGLNIPKTERQLALYAKQLLESAHSSDEFGAYPSHHLTHIVSNEDATQAFWEFNNESTGIHDRLAITAMNQFLTIGVGHRVSGHPALSVRSSILLYNGQSEAYLSNTKTGGYVDMGTRSGESIQTFEDQFLVTVAGLGLHGRIQRLNQIQNDSSSANFESAA